MLNYLRKLRHSKLKHTYLSLLAAVIHVATYSLWDISFGEPSTRWSLIMLAILIWLSYGIAARFHELNWIITEEED